MIRQRMCLRDLVKDGYKMLSHIPTMVGKIDGDKAIIYKPVQDGEFELEYYGSLNNVKPLFEREF